jgi:hypothetical protein
MTSEMGRSYGDVQNVSTGQSASSVLIPGRQAGMLLGRPVNQRIHLIGVCETLEQFNDVPV